MKRSIPLGRRLRAVRGKIVMALVWFTAAATSGALLLVQSELGNHGGVAVAVTRTQYVRAPESGRIAVLAVAANQRVEAGEILASIEVPGLTQQIAAAEAELRSLELQLNAEEADRGRKFARDLESARASWLRARVELERERAELTTAEQDLARAKAPGVLVAAGEIESFTALRDAARAGVEARTAEVDALERNYNEARERAGVSTSDLLKSAVEAATVNLESLKAVGEANVLRAPVAGVVTAPVGAVARDGRADVIDEIFPVPGQWVQAGVPVLMITEPATQDAVVFVDIGRARELAPGLAVSVRAGGQRYEATVRSVGVAVEPVPLRQLRDQTIAEWGVPVTLQVAGSVLTPGEALSVEF